MKRTSMLVLVVIFSGVVGIVGTEALAANLSFNPDSATVDALPGQSAVARVEANLESKGFCSVGMVIDSGASQGNLPPGWLRPVMVNLGNRMGGATSSPVSLTVEVPSDAPAGRYSAVINPRIIRTTESVDSSGVILVVQVVSDNKCDKTLSFENVRVGPENIWAPADKEVEIELTGTVVAAPECEVRGFYAMEDNDGPIAGRLDLDANGNFDQRFSVTVSKKGKLKEGATYRGTLSLEDEEGNKASQEFFVTVDHDRGKNGERDQKNK